MPGTPLHHRILTEITACVGFFTRIPVPAGIPLPADFAAAQWAAPLAGLLVGGIGAITLWIGLSVGLQPELSAIVSLAATLLATGCFHEDGLADICDGFGGGATPERKLEIMKDSRIGTFGVAGLALSLLARWAAISALAAVTPTGAIAAIIAANVGARAPMALFMRIVQPARDAGLSAKLGEIGATPASISLMIGFAALLLLGWPAALTACLCLLIWFVVLKRLCERQIGGHTGDVLGTLEQGGEIIILLIATIYLI